MLASNLPNHVERPSSLASKYDRLFTLASQLAIIHSWLDYSVTKQENV